MIRCLLLLMLLLGAGGAAGARELKLATWNMEWLTLRPAGDPELPDTVVPKRPDDWALLQKYALALDADVVALEEVDGPQAAAKVFPPDRYALFFTNDHVVQRVGFAVRRGIIVEQNPDLVGLDLDPRARYPLRSGADITLDFPEAKLRLLAVHLKAGCQQARLDGSGATCDALRRQLAPLQGWIAQRIEEGVPYVLLGDFNRRMDERDEFSAGLFQSGSLVRATAGFANPCWGGSSFIDHIFVGGAARSWIEPNSMRVLVYREGEADKERLSDHCPVSIRLRLPQ